MARRSRRLAARPRPVGIGRHARRRPRPLVRPPPPPPWGVRPPPRAAPETLGGARAPPLPCGPPPPPGPPRPPPRGPDGPPRHGYHRAVACGRSVVVAQKPSKLLGRVRFPSPA